MIKLIITAIIAFAAFVSISFAQDENSQNKPYYTLNGQKVYYDGEEPFKEYDNKLGVAASMFSGYGLSYQRHIGNGFRFEFTGSIYGSDGDYERYNDYYSSYSPNNETTLMYTIGFEIQKVFYSKKEIKLYAFSGMSYWYDYEELTYDYTDYNNKKVKYSESDKYKTYSIGLGFGGQYIITNQIIFDIEVGYLYNKQFGAFYDGNEDIEPRNRNTSSYYLGFGVGAGLYFAF